MKKIYYILLILSLALASCSKIGFDELRPEEVQQTGLSEFTFGVQIADMQPATKAGGSIHNPEITSLHVFVFDESGYLVQFAEASPLELKDKPAASWSIPSDQINKQLFTVTLKQSVAKRIVHVVANCPAEALKDADSGVYSEYEVLGNISVAGDKDVYWQRKEYTNILSGTVGKPTGLNNTCFQLVRNYAKVTVAFDSTIFKDKKYSIEGIVLGNTPDMSTLAPFNVNSGSFADYANPDYKALTDAKYYGFSPAGTTLKKLDSSSEPAFTSEAYMYEWNQYTNYTVEDSANPIQQPYVIAKANFNGTVKYLKLIFQEEEYFNILRGFEYKFNITKVPALELLSGSFEDVMKDSQNNGDICYNISTRNLQNITVGDFRLTVSYTERTIAGGGTDDDAHNTYLYFNLEYMGKDPKPSLSHSDVKVELKKPSIAGRQLVTNPTTTVDGADYLTPEESDKKVGWLGMLKLSTAEAQAQDISQELVLSYTNGDTKVTRFVKLWLIKPYRMTLTCESPIPATIGAKVPVSFSIPANIQQSAFPLDFTFEAVALSLSPYAGEDLAVRSGNGISIIPGKKDKNVFNFVKTLTYEDYTKAATDAENQKTFSVNFQTNKAVSASYVYAYNEYFKLAKDFFINPGGDNPVDPTPSGVYGFKLSQPYCGIDQETKVSFNVADDFSGDITIDVEGLKTTGVTSSNGTVNVVDGKIVYTPDGVGSHSITFMTSTESDPVSATLSFGTEQEGPVTQTRLKHNFNLKLNKETVGLTLDEDLEVTFDMPVIETIDMTLVGLTVPEDNRFKRDGEKVYFTPSVTGPQTITFKTTDVASDASSKAQVSVSLSHSYFEDASAIAKRKYSLTINSSTITSASGLNLGYFASSREIDIYTKANKYTTPSGNVTMTDNGISNRTVTIKDVVMSDEIYFRYKDGWGNYYYAKKTVEDLLKGGQSLSFDTTEL